MLPTIYEPLDAVADRPPIQHSPVHTTWGFGDVVREDLEDLALQAARAIRHCDELSRSVPALRSLDMQRDVLHLQARIGGLSRQIADATETLERMQQRTAAGAPSRQQLKLPLS